MPFDMMRNGGGGGGNGNDLVAKALAVIVSTLFSSGARPKGFGPGENEILNLDIQITVSPDGEEFRIDGARMLRWEQIETDVDDLIG